MVDQSPPPQEDGFFLEEEVVLAADAESSAGIADAKRPDFKEIWKKNPSLKVFAIVAGLSLMLISFMVLGSGDDTPKAEEESLVQGGNDISQPPGTAELPPAYEKAVREASEKRIEEAAQTGGSALPTPVARPAERIEAPVQVEEKDPLVEWRREAEIRRVQRKKEAEVKPPSLVSVSGVGQQPLPVTPLVQQAVNLPTAAPPAAPPPLPTGPTPEQIQNYMQGMQQQFSTILETQVPKESVLIKMNLGQIQSNLNKATTPAAGVNAATNTNPAANQAVKKPKPLITAGTIAYAQTLNEANSDVPGPILVEVASGPLAGGRAIGTLQVADEKLVLQFSRIVKDGEEYSVQAYAVDPATTLTAIATDVDHHYFTRVFLPAAATFIESFAEAATREDTTTVISNGTVVTDSQSKLDPTEQLYEALNEAGQKVSTFVDQGSQRPITVKVAIGTRIGLLFTESVFDVDTQAAMTQQQQQNLGQAVFNATPVGQAYNAYNIYSNATWGSAQQSPYYQMPQAQGTQMLASPWAAPTQQQAPR